MQLIRLAFLACLVMTLLDAVTTLVALSISSTTHEVSEGNPITAWMISMFGLYPALSIHLVIKVAVLYGFYYCYWIHWVLREMGLVFIAALTGLAVLNNLWVISSVTNNFWVFVTWGNH